MAEAVRIPAFAGMTGSIGSGGATATAPESPSPFPRYSKVATLNTTLKGMQYMTAEPNESRSAPGGIS